MERYLNRTPTIIYGGAFCPPTRAHQAILQACVNHAELIDADVWIMPSGQRADKTIDSERGRRLDMIRALTNDVVRRNVALSIETTEIDRETADGTVVRTETYDTVCEFTAKYPDRQFIWVFGSDSIETMPDWREGEWLIDNLPMLVIERPGTPIRSLGKHATRLSVDTIDTSSTIVRDRMKFGLPIDSLVPPSVLAYLAV